MTKEQYCKITGPFRSNPKAARCLHRLNRGCTIIIVAAYVLLLGMQFYGWAAGGWSKDETLMLLRSTLVPFAGFMTLTVFRAAVNRPRPYETFGMEPVIPKETKGKSFPSRHVFSACMIALTYLCLVQPIGAGILLLLAAVLIAVIRVLSGVHYLSDVLVGAGWAVVFAILGYIVI